MSTERKSGAFIYARFSTEHQHSVEEQVARCSLYCQERGLPVLGVYADEAVSGTKLSRQQYDMMMDDLRAGLADCIVIYDQSRLMRDVAGWFGARKALELMGVRVFSATQDYVGGDINKPDTYMMEGIQSIFDTMHVLITKQKVTEKLHYMANAGLHTGGRPALGYKTVIASDGKKRLAVDELEAVTVRRIFSQYAEGKSYREIISALNADGIRTKAGNSFGANSLHDMLKNPLYTGRVIYGSRPYRSDGSRNSHAKDGRNVVERLDEELRIIDQDTFEAVQKKLAQNAQIKAGRPSSSRVYPLKGKVFCGECGSALAVATSKIKGGEYYYYRCPRKNRTHDCEARPIRCDELEQAVAEQVKALIGCPDIRDRALGYLQEYADQINQNGLDRFQRLTEDRQKVTAKINNLIAAIEDGNYIPSMKDRLAALEQERATISARMDELARAAEIASVPAKRMEELFRKVCDIAQDDNNALLSIVARVEVYNDHIRIYTAFDPDPKPGKRNPEEHEFIINDGTPSGVPSFIINASGIVIAISRKH